MPEPTVGPGDSDYATLFAAWEASGSPSGQFERTGGYGGQRWRVHDLGNEDGPTFLLIAAAGPTSTGYDEETKTFKSADWRGPRSGYEYESRDTGLEIRPGAGGEGDFRIKMKSPPRDLKDH